MPSEVIVDASMALTLVRASTTIFIEAADVLDDSCVLISTKDVDGKGCHNREEQ